MTHTKDQYAVMGNPIEHSRSPEIHQVFAKQTNQFIEYTKIQVPLDGFAQAVNDFFVAGGKGLNITVPFKQEAYDLVDVLTHRARLAGAVNTIVLGKNGKLYGDNTDGIGLIRDITQNLKKPIKGKRILILGAGGAVRGILGPLFDAGAYKIVMVNRTLVKAQALKEFFPLLEVCSYEDLQTQEPFDWVINGTSASLNQELPPLPDGLFTENGAAYDLVYANQTTAFNQWAKDQGATLTADGLGMLVEQAAEAFYLWRHKRPETAPVIQLFTQLPQQLQ